ncbi:MAG TPA: hypothetical protein DCS93_19020 [Microscillaceae bacterium]|nr:hypothetical protein [Microscillaceae bacterium]
MLLKTQFQIVETSTPITEPITKFGGQPVWINTPHWPIDPASGEKMMFQSQIVLDPALFPDSNGAIAYIFYGDEEQLSNYDFVVVLQTKENESLNTQTEEIDFVNEATGPAIYEWVEIGGEEEKVSKEYKVVIESVIEEEDLPLLERYDEMNDLDYDAGYQFSKTELAGNKIGGQPFYITGLDTPPEHFVADQWEQLMQLAPVQGYWDGNQPNFYPFYMEMGEFGILNVFITKDYKRAEVYIQTP